MSEERDSKSESRSCSFFAEASSSTAVPDESQVTRPTASARQRANLVDPVDHPTAMSALGEGRHAAAGEESPFDPERHFFMRLCRTEIDEFDGSESKWVATPSWRRA